ncbi:MAG TPA: pyridoxal-phosphate dependent enzyme [Casimicrobiaceae bacterium]|jgi:threonine dehydratase
MAPPDLRLPDLAAIEAAHTRIAPHVVRTPVVASAALDALAGAALLFKCENLQRVGAFKARGACNAVLGLDEAQAARGVVTHSSGNHGAAVAYAAQRRGVAAHVVMPSNSPRAKQDNVRRYGASIHFCEPNVPSREATCAEVMRDTGALLIHPFDNMDVIAGQGTAALELLEEAPELDAIVTPVGGGGLLSGTGIAARGMRPALQVYGAEPAEAGDAAAGFRAGRMMPPPSARTIADGLRSGMSERTFAAMRAHATDVATCSEAAIVRAMRLMWEHLGLVVEPSSAVPLACMLEGSLDLRGRRAGVIVTGGNVDLDRLPWQ